MGPKYVKSYFVRCSQCIMRTAFPRRKLRPGGCYVATLSMLLRAKIVTNTQVALSTLP